MKTAEELWQRDSLSIGAEVKKCHSERWSRRIQSLSACLFEMPDKGREGGTRYYLPWPRPSINPAREMGIAWILPTALEHGTIPFQPPLFLGKAYGS